MVQTTTTGEPRGDFQQLADPYRRELLAHCYRMLGSVHDAEDLVQETYLRAWRAYDRFEDRSSLRTWLYRIATNACLTALESRGRRPMPTGLGGPSTEPAGDLIERSEVPWLEPLPDVAIGADNADGVDPATVVTSRESVRLALVAALQHLPPRQRAVLVLRDVLRWKAAEVADLLETSPAAVNSMLQRAHAQLDRVAPSPDDAVEPLTPETRELLDRYVTAFENYDVDAIVRQLTEDAVWEMPPFAAWFVGSADIGELILVQCPMKAPGDLRIVRISANGQPALAQYLRGADGVHRPFAIQVVTAGPAGISHVGQFFDLSLFPLFGLPDALP
ncbi:sigma-70 family RNA polymerase sigma factor [Jiangella ureilytica]|uniref:RNA polymerase sigma factor n=1 Tax=Jiangella ureilytica TaxID=2530374 RepID=A0A4R4RMK5_9ACTN|nr:sigma-70 family RNA polymerase sigma factor [Jiangella ureilytica]TDC49902.1 sigma-70 family RNA polymerase sigma factor [Jiangella ureilytica]